MPSIKIDGGQAIVTLLVVIVGVGTMNLLAASAPDKYVSKCWHALMTQ